MLSYQHIYHAGNHVDCHKHALLGALLGQLGAFHYIDTHTGRGLYDLNAPEARKIQEYALGIDKIWSLGNWPKELRPYQNLLKHLNRGDVCRFYPGSPHVALAYGTDDTKLDLYEIHPQELAALDENMDGIPNITIHDTSGWSVLANDLPDGTAQKVILVDPSYEMKEEYVTLPDLVARALIQDPSAIIVVWYPLLKAGRHQLLLNGIKDAVNAPVLQNEIHIADADTAKGLYATGVLCINPPDGYDVIVQKISKWLTEAIGTSSTTEWLVSPRV